MFKETVVNDKSKGQEVKLPCLQCSTETIHKVISSVDIRGVEEEQPGYVIFDYETIYQIVKCQGCNSYSFRTDWTNSEDGYDDPHTDVYYPNHHEELYPGRMRNCPKLKDSEHIPNNIYQIYEEVYQSICNKQTILAGIGIRLIVESICKHKGAKQSNLYARINELVDMGVLTREGVAILQNIRIIGNASAHDGIDHGEETLIAAINVINHLLTGVYILPVLNGLLKSE